MVGRRPTEHHGAELARARSTTVVPPAVEEPPATPPIRLRPGPPSALGRGARCLVSAGRRAPATQVAAPGERCTVLFGTVNAPYVSGWWLLAWGAVLLTLAAR